MNLETQILLTTAEIARASNTPPSRLHREIKSGRIRPDFLAAAGRIGLFVPSHVKAITDILNGPHNPPAILA